MVRISDIEVSSGGPIPGHLLEVRADDGTTGLAFCTAALAPPAIVSFARAVLVGEDPRAAPCLWERMQHAAAGAPIGHAIAALDLAVWDLKAKAAAEPLWRTLGGARPRANCYVTVQTPVSTTELEAFLTRRARDLGVREAKITASADPEEDLEHLLAARRILSAQPGEPVLMLDAGAAWDPKQASQRLGRLERHVDLAWVEDPRPPGDVLGLRRISRSIRGAVCSGGRLGPGDFLALLHQRAADVVEVDLARTGISGALRVADAVLALELPVTLAAVAGNLHVHLAPVLPNFVSLELADPERLPASITSAARLQDGWVTAGDAPGLGLAREDGA